MVVGHFALTDDWKYTEGVQKFRGEILGGHRQNDLKGDEGYICSAGLQGSGLRLPPSRPEKAV